MKNKLILVLLAVMVIAASVIISGLAKNDARELPVIRAQKIELVDARGRVRASLKIEENGETVFRIMDADGTIRVKVGGLREGSGMVLLNDATEPGLHIMAKSDGTQITLANKDGSKKIITP
jgi:hypothetical protein